MATESSNWHDLQAALNAPEAECKLLKADVAAIERITLPGGVYYRKTALEDIDDHGNRYLDDYAVEMQSNRLTALQRGIGHTMLEQLVGYSEAENSLVTAALPGTSLFELSPRDITTVSADHLRHLLVTFTEMDDREIIADPESPGNFTFDAESGFYVLDYAYKDARLPRDIEWPIHNFITMLADLDKMDHSETTYPGWQVRPRWREVQDIGAQVILDEYGDLSNPALATSRPNMQWLALRSLNRL